MGSFPLALRPSKDERGTTPRSCFDTLSMSGLAPAVPLAALFVEQDDGHGGDPFAAAQGAQAFGAGGLHVDPR